MMGWRRAGRERQINDPRWRLESRSSEDIDHRPASVQLKGIYLVMSQKSHKQAECVDICCLHGGREGGVYM